MRLIICTGELSGGCVVITVVIINPLDDTVEIPGMPRGIGFMRVFMIRVFLFIKTLICRYRSRISGKSLFLTARFCHLFGNDSFCIFLMCAVILTYEPGSGYRLACRRIL